MRIFIVVDSLGLSMGGGVGSFIFDLSKTLIKKGNDIHLIGIVNRKEKTDVLLTELLGLGINTFELGAKDRKQALINLGKYCLKLRHYIAKKARGEQCICNVHLKLGTLYGAFGVLGISNVKVVETYHSQYSNYKLENLLLSPIIKKYICVSDSARDEMINRFYPAKQKACSICNGVDVKNIISKTSLINRKAKPIKIASVGRLTYQKNFETTINAFKDLDPEEVKYTIIGNGSNYNDLISLKGLSDVVDIIPFIIRDDLLQLIRNTDIVCMPSRWEGLSIFMLETMALERPLIVSDIPAFRNILQEDPLEQGELWRLCSWGYLVETENETAYKEALLHFINHSELHEKMSNCISSLVEKYDISVTAEEYIKVFKKVLAL